MSYFLVSFPFATYLNRIWRWVYYNRTPIYPIFYLLKGDYNHFFMFQTYTYFIVHGARTCDSSKHLVILPQNGRRPLNPRTLTLNPKPPNPKPQILEPKPYAGGTPRSARRRNPAKQESPSQPTRQSQCGLEVCFVL